MPIHNTGGNQNRTDNAYRKDTPIVIDSAPTSVVIDPPPEPIVVDPPPTPEDYHAPSPGPSAKRGRSLFEDEMKGLR